MYDLCGQNYLDHYGFFKIFQKIWPQAQALLHVAIKSKLLKLELQSKIWRQSNSESSIDQFLLIYWLWTGFHVYISRAKNVLFMDEMKWTTWVWTSERKRSDKEEYLLLLLGLSDLGRPLVSPGTACLALHRGMSTSAVLETQHILTTPVVRISACEAEKPMATADP